jgi:hypothetical protein
MIKILISAAFNIAALWLWLYKGYSIIGTLYLCIFTPIYLLYLITVIGCLVSPKMGYAFRTALTKSGFKTVFQNFLGLIYIFSQAYFIFILANIIWFPVFMITAVTLRFIFIMWMGYFKNGKPPTLPQEIERIEPTIL